MYEGAKTFNAQALVNGKIRLCAVELCHPGERIIRDFILADRIRPANVNHKFAKLGCEKVNKIVRKSSYPQPIAHPKCTST